MNWRSNGRTLGFALALIGVGVAGAAFAACTAVLGDDYRVTEGSGGAGGQVSTGGQGPGGTAGTGGSGGVPLPAPYTCSWSFPSHFEVDNLRATPSDSWDSHAIALARQGDGLRLFVLRRTPNGNFLEVRGLDTGPHEGVTAYPAAELFGAVRLGPLRTAALILDDTNGPVFKLVTVDDNDFAGANAIITTVTAVPSIAFADWQPNSSFDAILSSVTGAQPAAVDIVWSYATTAGEYIERYGRFQVGDAPIAPVRITPTNVSLGSNEVSPRVMVDGAGSSFVFMGEIGSLLGTREYQLNPTVVGPQAPRQVGGVDLTAIAALGRASDTLFSAARFNAQGIEILVGDIPNPELGTFDPETALASGGIFPSMAALPVAEGALRWLGTIMAFVGTSSADPLTMRYWFTDYHGLPRGTGQLPFTATTAGVRDSIADVAVERRDSLFDVVGGQLHVVWWEHQTETAPGYYVMYYDLMVCTP